VTGVDTFVGDKHTTNKKNVYDETVRPFENVRLIRSDYRDWFAISKAATAWAL
jgi:hypothetical protein